MVKLKEVKETFVKMLSVIKNDNNREVVRLKVTIPGNKEMFSLEISENVQEACSELGFHLQSCFVFSDESWTDVKIEVIDLKHLSSYIDTLNKKLQVRDTPRMYINAMNKAIMMLENFNNMHGNDKTTREINELDDILKLLQ